MDNNEGIKKNRFTEWLNNIFANSVLTIKNLRVIFITSIVCFILLALQIFDVGDNLPKDYRDLFVHLACSLVMSILFAIPATFISFKFTPLKKYLIQVAAVLAGGVVGYFAYKGFGNKSYDELYFLGIAFAVILISVFILLPSENNQTYFAGLIKHFFFCVLMTLIVFGGLSLLIFAVQNLILSIDESEPYECCAAFCACVFAVNTFCHYLFFRRQEESSGKAFKVIVLYILLPVFFTLVAILYAYLIKALVLRRLPNGQINWFVSFASCFYIVFYFILREYDYLGVVRFFYRFGAFAFIPLICIQIPAFFIRVNAYGFTGARYSSLLFIVFSVITIALTFIKKGAFTKYAIPFLALIILFASLTPFNLIDMAYKSQFGRMMNVLKNYDLYDEGAKKLKEYDAKDLEEKISVEDREQLYSSWRYLYYTSSLKKPEWFDGSFESLFGIKAEVEDAVLENFSFYIDKDFILDIEGYKKMQPIEVVANGWGYVDSKWEDYAKELPAFIADINDKKYDLTDFVFSLDKNKIEDRTEPLFYSPEENVTFCITSLSYKWNENLNLFREYSMYGYALYK